jgi:hypothetical protein
LALLQSLINVGTAFELAVLIGLPDGVLPTGVDGVDPLTNVSHHHVRTLRQMGATIIYVPKLQSEWVRPGTALPALGTGVWLKLHLWAITRWHRLVYLDADFLVMQNIDELCVLPLKPDHVFGVTTSALGYSAGYFGGGILALDSDPILYKRMLAQLEVGGGQYQCEFVLECAR